MVQINSPRPPLPPSHLSHPAPCELVCRQEAEQIDECLATLGRLSEERASQSVAHTW